jgi:hypothetical protein
MIPGTMSRTAKGRVAPAPRLADKPQQTAELVAALPNVSVQAHWEIGSQEDVNGTDFYVGAEELGHIHLDGEAHIPIGAALAAVLVQAKLAKRFRWSAQFVVVDAANTEVAVWTFALRHAQIEGVSHADLKARIAMRATRSH